jgi:hypothetical protein
MATPHLARVAGRQRRLTRAGHFPHEARVPPMSQLVHLLKRLATAAEAIAGHLGTLAERQGATPPPTPGRPGAAADVADPELRRIADTMGRLAEHLAPEPAAVVGTPHVARRLGCTTVWVAEMARQGQIPRDCLVPGTGDGKPWKFYRSRIDAWLASR